MTITELRGGRTRVSVGARDKGHSAPQIQCETAYPVELIEQILAIAGPAGLCDELRRDEDPSYVEHYLRWAMLSYFDEGFFEGKRVLDFGCGRGASTMVMARMFPRTDFIGVELDPDSLKIAELRARHYGRSNITFLRSPSGDELPPGLGDFDCVCLSAVYEHLLPDERRLLLPKLWAVLKPGGVLFLNQTPHRYFPVEYHSTGLPLINYVPDRWAAGLARRLSRRVDAGASWDELLRGGFRGATQREVLRVLQSAGADPELLRPARLEARDPVDLWFLSSTSRRPSRLKSALRPAFKVLSRMTDGGFVPSLEIAIRKRG